MRRWPTLAWLLFALWVLVSCGIATLLIFGDGSQSLPAGILLTVVNSPSSFAAQALGSALYEAACPAPNFCGSGAGGTAQVTILACILVLGFIQWFVLVPWIARKLAARLESRRSRERSEK